MFKKNPFGIPTDAAERAACKWLSEHCGEIGEPTMRSLAQAMRDYAERRFGHLGDASEVLTP